MKRYTLYKISTAESIHTGKPYPVADGVSEPPEMDADFVLLEEITEAKPTYDNATHKLIEDAINYNTIDKTATRSWSSVALTQAELDKRIPAHVEINGIKWKTDEASQAAFASMTLLIDKAAMPASDMVMIKDAMGVSQAMTVTQYQADVLSYGLACYSQFHSQ